MDSSELLDILGNKNRRKILELLAYKPCYVTEISEYIGVSPKAVIDHLKMLENAGLIESRVDDRRRKYFYITRNVRLEVNVSPYTFGVKHAYPRRNFKANYEYLNIKYKENKGGESSLGDLASQLEQLEKIENELSLAQRYIQSRITEVMEEIENKIEKSSQNPVQAEVLTQLISSNSVNLEKISRELGISEEVMRENLRMLEKRDIVELEKEEKKKWKVVD